MWFRKNYHCSVLPVLEGEAHGIKAVFREFPALEDQSGRLWEYSRDFNLALLIAIWKEIDRNPERVVEDPNLTFHLFLRVHEQNVKLDITLNEFKTKEQFRAELPDALIAAFEHAHIQPRTWFS